jgi:hypothetical protein
MRAIVGRKGLDRRQPRPERWGGSRPSGWSATPNLAALTDLSEAWIDQVHRRRPPDGIILDIHALAYNLANFLRTLALPERVEHWSLTTLREKLVKIGARIVRHGRYVVFQLAR